IYFVASMMMMYTVGIAIASLGRLNIRQALSNLLKVPSMYAMILAVLFAGWNLSLPHFLERTVDLGAGGTIPAMLVLLGIELQRATRLSQPIAISIPSLVRLVAGPFLAWILASFLALPLPARQAGIVQAGMPTAVLTTVVASEYKLDTALVTAIVFFTTILSPLTLTPLLFFVGR
ncbi:MAG: AEC family transporter, partial [Anaerolineales bacterium]|nr:AEC family transporter [Anaerolineales bacterium]